MKTLLLLEKHPHKLLSEPRDKCGQVKSFIFLEHLSYLPDSYFAQKESLDERQKAPLSPFLSLPSLPL